MSLESDLLKIEDGFWTGGPEAYRQHADKQCLVAFAEMAGVMSNEDIAKSAETGALAGCIHAANWRGQSVGHVRRDHL
jgi:hypothetical protein